MAKLVFNQKLKTLEFLLASACAHTIAILKISMPLVFLFLLQCVWAMSINLCYVDWMAIR